MSNPTVCAIMLTRDRPQMAARAVRCFREQTYENKVLVIWDTTYPATFHRHGQEEEKIAHIAEPERNSVPIGTLRNRANAIACTSAVVDILAHWDDDDVSHPNRLAEQVALLQASGADAVGYNSMLFWDTRAKERKHQPFEYDPTLGEAWLYRAINPQHILGTSLMYHRATWERQPFDDVPSGEDTRWIAKLGNKAVGVSSLHSREMDINTKLAPGQIVDVTTPYEPRMIASVHGGNSSGYAPEKDRASTKRVPEWDDYCRKVMQL